MKKEKIEQANELIFNSERQKEIEIFARSLMGLVTKVDVFGDDNTDEFKVIRENGKSQGIFKTWAVPVIPFFEDGSVEELANNLSKNGHFWDKLGPGLENKIKEWSEEMASKPLKLWQNLEKWRGFTEIHDKRLQTIFSERELPTQKVDRAAELFLRLITAFGFAAPFYHLEAMAGDLQNTKLNPIGRSKNNNENSGGALDLVAMALPAALKNKVLAKRLDWSGLNWEKINNMSKFDPSDKESVLAFRIAKAIGVDISDIIFASNVLQWIPVSVGGKTEDIPTLDAQRLIEGSLKPINSATTETVARNINALIRFFNWFPLIKGSENFAGKNWRYAAACDTSDALLAEVNAGGVLEANFETIFNKDLAEQVKHLDATSAKGRFMIQLLNEGKLGSEIYKKIKEKSPGFFKDVSIKLAIMEKNEAVFDINEVKPRFAVGGKAAGLREAALIFGKEKVAPGLVITSEAVENWLKRKPLVWKGIQKINRSNNISEKIAVGRIVSDEIKNTNFSIDNILGKISGTFQGKLAVRSSSFDEDTDYNGSAAGIYESEVNVNSDELNVAISKVVSSFFSEKAISYRHMQGLGDVPMFAVVIGPFIEGHGGAAFSSGNGTEWEIVVADRPSNVVGNSTERFDSYKKKGESITSVVKYGWINDGIVKQVGNMLLTAEKVIGGRIDMEFVVDKNGTLRILQLRSIKDVVSKVEKHNSVSISTIRLDSLKDLEKIISLTESNIKLVLNKQINIDQFQGTLFRWLTINRDKISEISLSQRIPRTSHFANLCINLGINLIFEENG